ncbi:MAG TPA: holo-ACP synthase [Syntrophomonadaceae bacterium]|nr:holo-ACP synthase [Syntrophomonadaceae bacterium]
MLVGVDIVDIERIKTAVERTPRFLHRIFTPREIEYCLNKKNPYPSLAVRFAAKEAVRKLHPLFSRGISFHDVEVINNKDGRPQLLLHNKALVLQKEAGIDGISISLSHAKYQAIATIVAQERVV